MRREEKIAVEGMLPDHFQRLKEPNMFIKVQKLSILTKQKTGSHHFDQTENRLSSL